MLEPWERILTSCLYLAVYEELLFILWGDYNECIFFNSRSCIPNEIFSMHFLNFSLLITTHCVYLLLIWGFLVSLLESVHTVLIQPRTPVSFQGMFIYLLFDFRKLRIFQCFPFPENSGTPTFPISGNSGLRHFPRFSYYVILLVSCLHPSLVTLSAVGNTSLSPDPQFPSTLPYCLAYVTQFPLLCTGTTLVHSLVISTCILYLDHQN